MKLREPEVILAQMQARLEEIRVEVEKPENVYPCKTCRWSKFYSCYNPLVIGIKSSAANWDYVKGFSSAPASNAAVCGPEKALWRPKLTLWQWIVNFLSRNDELDGIYG